MKLQVSHHDQAKQVFDEAQKLGLDAPTEDMVAEAISAACFNAVLEAGGQELLDKWLTRGVKEARLALLEAEVEDELK